MYLVAGLGLTGQSVLRYFASQGEACLAFDTRADFDVSTLAQTYGACEFATGSLPESWASRCSTLVLSPGIARADAWVQALVAKGVNVIGDIELFARAVGKPVIGITGSNGKSTVSTLVAQVLSASGLQVGLGGNIGVPALDLLDPDKEYDVFVLELSSFQLETTYSLQTISATILNISEDHMDRYAVMGDYLQAKLAILSNTEWTVLPNALRHLCMDNCDHTLSFSLNDVESLTDTDYGLIHRKHQTYLGFGQTPLLAIEDMAQQAPHCQLNALATMALCRPFNVPAAIYQQVFKQFTGLPHRTQWVACAGEVTWINDSKGTNVGATLTALHSFNQQAKTAGGRIILLAGGVGKEADFSELGQALNDLQALCILFGQDAPLIQQALVSDNHRVENLMQAIQLADSLAQAGDIVLFSPACASFDQFDNYVHRGTMFETWVKAHLVEKGTSK